MFLSDLTVKIVSQVVPAQRRSMRRWWRALAPQVKQSSFIVIDPTATNTGSHREQTGRPVKQCCSFGAAFHKKGFAILVFGANMGDSRSRMLPCRLFAFRAPVFKVADASRFTGHRDRLF